MNRKSTNPAKPPRWASYLLRRWADPNTVEEVEGDLLEMYAYWQQCNGLRRAKWRYLLSVLTLLRPFAKKKRSKDYSKF
jgi:putative ABC transport system permease protein